MLAGIGCLMMTTQDEQASREGKIVFYCPACSRTIRVPMIEAGRAGKCMTCGEPLKVPEIRNAVASPRAAVILDAPTPRNADASNRNILDAICWVLVFLFSLFVAIPAVLAFAALFWLFVLS